MRAAIFVGKSLLKIFLLPVILCLTVIQWICTAAVSVVSILLELIGGVFILSGLGRMYGGDGDFTTNIDRAGGEGTAQFACDAIQIYCG